MPPFFASARFFSATRVLGLSFRYFPRTVKQNEERDVPDAGIEDLFPVEGAVDLFGQFRADHRDLCDFSR